MQSIHKYIETKSRKICSVPQCSSYCTKEISLHAFPLDLKLKELWKTALKIGKPVTKYMLVCSHHFTESDFTIATNRRRRLKKNAIPSKKIPQLSHPTTETAINRAEGQWLQKCSISMSKQQMGIEDQSLLQPDDKMTDMGEELLEEPPTVSKYDKIADMGEEPATVSKSDKITDMGEKLTTVSKSDEDVLLLSHVGPFSNKFTEDKATQIEFCDFFELPQILNSDEKLINFCGITSDILKTITKCAEYIAAFNKCSWSNIETRIILVLCKLKMNISFACLAVLFKISNSQCRAMFYSTVSLLAVSLKPAIYWPSKEEILNNMPKCFDKFKNCRVVLDCTEIKIQRMKCLKCRIASYSHYKGMHTVKFLIGITPSGLISFVSAGFGGRATDKAIFNYEKLIDKLDIHDAVMVDKGILIEKECNEKLVKVIIPPFLRKQKQFSEVDAKATADIARARVHVERAIQRIKIFKILSKQLNWYLIPYADEIMTIIAAIVNLSPPILADSKIN